MIVIDTHVLIWLNSSPEELRPDTLARLASEDVIAISAMSAWELLVAFEKGRVRHSGSPQDTLERWLALNKIRVFAANYEVIRLGRSLAFAHDDPLDRIIAATAYKEGVELVTRDAKLLSLSWLKTIEA